MNNVTVVSRYSVWTMLTDGDSYALSAIKLLDSICRHTSQPFDANLLELTSKPLRPEIRQMLVDKGWRVCQVERLPARGEDQIYVGFRDQFAKLYLWRMIEYESVVYMDSDCFVVGNIDSLFEVAIKHKEMKIAAARDNMKGVWQETFNMGVFVVRPSLEEFNRFMLLREDVNFRYEIKWAEQGFLNSVYNNSNQRGGALWHELDFVYNANIAVFTHMPDYWSRRERDIRILHYTVSKPWRCRFMYARVCELWMAYRLETDPPSVRLKQKISLLRYFLLY